MGNLFVLFQSIWKLLTFLFSFRSTFWLPIYARLNGSASKERPSMLPQGERSSRRLLTPLSGAQSSESWPSQCHVSVTPWLAEYNCCSFYAKKFLFISRS